MLCGLILKIKKGSPIWWRSPPNWAATGTALKSAYLIDNIPYSVNGAFKPASKPSGISSTLSTMSPKSTIGIGRRKDDRRRLCMWHNPSEVGGTWHDYAIGHYTQFFVVSYSHTPGLAFPRIKALRLGGIRRIVSVRHNSPALLDWGEFATVSEEGKADAESITVYIMTHGAEIRHTVADACGAQSRWCLSRCISRATGATLPWSTYSGEWQRAGWAQFISAYHRYQKKLGGLYFQFTIVQKIPNSIWQ